MSGAVPDRVRALLAPYAGRLRARVGPRAERALAWLRRSVSAAADLSWLRPRRALLPAVSFWSLFALAALHRPLGRAGQKCVTVDACGEVLADLASGGHGALLELAGYYLFAAGSVYVLAVGVTAAAGYFVALRERYRWLFAPDDEELLAVAVVLVAAVLTYAAGVVGAAYSLLGLLTLYVVYAPSLGTLAALFVAAQANPLAGATDPLVSILELSVGLGAVVLAPALQVLWLYALAHGAVRALRGEL